MVFGDEVFGEVIRVKSGHDAVAPMTGLVPFWEDTLEGLFALSLSLCLYLSTPLENTRRQQSANQQESSSRTWPCWHPDLGFPVFKTAGNKWFLVN